MSSNGKFMLPKDPEKVQEIIQNYQRKLDRTHRQAADARALVFDLMYPNGYKTEDGDFKQQFVYFKEELGKVVKQRDELREELKKRTVENVRLKAILKGQRPEGVSA